MSLRPHFYRYQNNWAIGVGYERTFYGNRVKAFRFGLGWWCLSFTWGGEKNV